MFSEVRKATELHQSFHFKIGVCSAHQTQQLDRNDSAYYNNAPNDYYGSIGPQAGFDFDYFGFGLVESGTVPNGTLEHPW